MLQLLQKSLGLMLGAGTSPMDSIQESALLYTGFLVVILQH